MRYLLKQKFFAVADTYTLCSEDGRPLFRVEGKVFSLGDQLRFLDLEGRELAGIHQRFLSWGPTYEIHRNGQVVAVVKKALFTLFNCRFTVDVTGPDDLEAEGDFLDQEYVFRRGDRVVARVSRSFFALGDTYGVEVAEGEDDLLVLASAVVIDLACHSGRE